MTRAPRWTAPVGAALLILGLAAAHARYDGIAPRGGDAPPEHFSAERAIETLEVLLGDESPHPVQSGANVAVRERLEAQLRALGLEPTLAAGQSCGRRRCAHVVNVKAWIPGRREGPALMLVSHYDSVPQGPGASDAGVQVASIVEIARALLREAPFESPILLLFTDGEEAGLLGAKAFVREDADARRVALAINLEARGTSGPSLFFESGPRNAWVAESVAETSPRPLTSSAYYTMYKLMPNDTDFTVFKMFGIDGANFAYIRGLSNYHTHRDTVANVDPASVQHQGENALALARKWAARDLSRLPDAGDALYFDVLGLFVVQLPIGAALPLALLALVLVVGSRWRALTSLKTGPGRAGAAIGLGAVCAAIVLPILLSLGFAWLVRVLTDHPQPWFGAPWASVAMHAAIALGVLAVLAAWLGGRLGALGLWTAGWVFWALMGVLVAATLPGMSYLFSVPALIAGLAGVALAGREAPWARATLVLAPLVGAALLWLPTARGLYDVMGGTLSPLPALVSVLMGLTLWPALAGLRRPKLLPLSAAAAALLLAILAVALAPSSSAEDLDAWMRYAPAL